MYRLLLLLASLAIIGVVAVLSACGDDEPQPAAQQQTQTAAAQPQQQDRQQGQQSDQPEPAETQEQQEQQQQPQPASAQQTEQTQTAQAQPQQSQQQQQQQTPESETKLVLGGDRPATLLLPEAADRAQPRPLIVLLHGYSSRASEADAYFQFSQWVEPGQFGLLLPDGTVDEINNQFWNGTPECCDIFGAEVDDVAYLKSLIEEARQIAAFDQIFAVGHSNGGFMAYRLACEDVPGLTGIVSLAGAAFADPDDCRVPTPLSVLQIHGTKDADVLYEGGRLPAHPDPDRAPTPGAKASVLRWAERAACDLDAYEQLSPIDTDTAVAGDETSRLRYQTGCADDVRVELWTIEGGGHIPFVWDTDFTPGILEWLGQVYGLDVQLLEPGAAEGVETIEIGGERSAQLLAPADRGDEPIPLILSLHGYQGDADSHDWYFGLSARIAEYNFALITPQGTTDQRGYPFWNATSYCCDLYGSGVDDAAWLTGLVDEARAALDISGVYIVGYSNGGFMAYRLACDGLDGLVAIASLAGSSHGDPAHCENASPISVLQIHGNQDQDIPYDGYQNPDGLEWSLPGATEVTARWAERADCNLEAIQDRPNLDLEATIPGPETKVQQIRQGCADGIAIELWTIEAADHYPHFQQTWPDHLLTWLLQSPL